MTNITYEKILSDLKSHSYFEVALGVEKEAIEKTAQHFLDFLTLPQGVKDSFTFILDENDRGSNAGYARKNRDKGDSDDKEYFNYRLITGKILQDRIQENRANPKVINFMESAGWLYEQSTKVLKDILKVLDTRHPGLYDRIFSKPGEEPIALRFVKYDHPEIGKLAKAHYDRSSCTLAIAESAPGLRIGKDENSLKEVVRTMHSAIFFPSFTFGEAAGSQEFIPAWHDVVQKTEYAYNQEVARWSIVLFADFQTRQKISYSDTHVVQDY